MTEQSLLTSVAGYGLRGGGVLADEPLSEERWGQLLSNVRAERVVPQLLHAATDGAITCSGEQMRDLEQAQLDAMAHVLQLDHLLVEVASILESSEIRFRVLKGSALAHLDYSDPSLRCYGDVDLLIDQTRYADAIEALGDVGITRRSAEVSPGFDSRFGKGTTLVTDVGYEVDLHRMLVFGPFGVTITPEELFAREEGFIVGSTPLPALALEERFLHACVHAVLGSARPRLIPLRDVAEIAFRDDLDLALVHRLAVGWNAASVVAAAVTTAWDTFALADAIALSVWAAGYEPTAREARALRMYRGRRSWSAQAIASLPVIPGWKTRADYTRALLAAAVRGRYTRDRPRLSTGAP
jgi:hypothetical protein